MPGYSNTVLLDDSRRTLNGALKPARNQTMLTLIGNPRGTYDEECRWPTNQSVLDLVVTRDIGPFRVSGLRPAVDTLELIFKDIKAEKPDIYPVIGQVGMLCCRLVRGSRSSISNHSWGTAIDLTLEGKLDRRGDNRTQVGLLELYPIFNRHGFYWGAAFPTEDAMHFEASDDLVHEWSRTGRLGDAPKKVGDSLVSFGDRGDAVLELQELLNLALGMDLTADGTYGPATQAAVFEFQRVNGLTVDGVVGSQTWKALRAVAARHA